MHKKIFLLFSILQIFMVAYGNKYIVIYKTSRDLNTLSSKVDILNVGIHNLALVRGDSVTIKNLKKDGYIKFYEKPAKAKAFFTPNDYYYGYQWDFNMLNMENVWDITMGASNVIIGLLDTGVGYENYTIPSYEQDEVVSGDGQYHIGSDFNETTFVSGYDYVHDDTHPNDENGHGTHVAGTMAEATNNNLGVAGMAPNVKIMPVQVLDYKGEGDSYAIANGIYFACDHGADVINLSLGGAPGDSTGWHVVHLAIVHACSLNIPVVVATGNGGVDELSYPAAFIETFACGALNYDKERSAYSQYGRGIDFVMPGGDESNYPNHMILQQTFRGYNSEYGSLARVDSFAYYYYEGTSMAAPHLTAAIALLKSKGINDINKIYGKLAYFATDLGSTGYDRYYGYGLPDIYTALTSSYSDNTPPSFNVYLIENPIFEGFINVWIRSNEELMNGVIDSVTVENNGNVQMSRCKLLQDRLFAGKFRFFSDGSYNVCVYGRDVWGNSGQKSTVFSLYKIPVSEEKTVTKGALRFIFPKNAVESDCIVRIEKDNSGFSISIPEATKKPIYLESYIPIMFLMAPDGNTVKPVGNKFVIGKSGYYKLIWDIRSEMLKGGIKLLSKSNLSGTVSVVSLSGRLIRKKYLSDQREIIIKGMKRGIYFAVIKNKNFTVRKRFSVW
ncbi:hypothetical protein DRP44_07825 [candidate division TA06 bacterium]|uniref:Peptidase S8/S53 domain-containing protein n=1 Tax=candidate division TA06 bacterium TaxID=2250710 RepID=A0A660S5C3_UNCT6|nr:MAG: hypothetical protein DRP44_07825 [candidate division TA06 bacterium]